MDKRTKLQKAKDKEIAEKGGIVVGKNAPQTLRYRRVRMNIEIRYIDSKKN